MQKSYHKNYFKIYLWQGIALVLSFVSMFIVTPYLSSSPSIYGIYMVCISMNIFFSYADLGFIGAGQKYAAEYFARGEKKEEIQIIGFSSFILLIFAFLCSFVFLFLSHNPVLLIKNLHAGEEYLIASRLLLILAASVPIIILQRIITMIFSIRLQDYLVQRVNVVTNILRIISIYYFFGQGKYDIVGYFLFIQILTFIMQIFLLLVARHKFDYSLKLLLRSICFKKQVFSKTRNLAFTSLFITVSWIIYYELDSIVIIKFLGAEKVAIYAIGLTALSLFRSLFGSLFAPFGPRFNHFIGVNDTAGLKNFFFVVIKRTAPFVIFPIITFSLLSGPFVMNWVGNQYKESIFIIEILSLCNIFAFISYPAGLLLMSQERVKEIYWIGALVPLVYWLGVFSSVSFLGIRSFYVFKFVSFFIPAVFYLLISKRFLETSVLSLFKRLFTSLIVPLVFLISFLMITKSYLPYEKSKLNLFYTVSLGCVGLLLTYVVLFFTSAETRKLVSTFFNKKDDVYV